MQAEIVRSEIARRARYLERARARDSVRIRDDLPRLANRFMHTCRSTTEALIVDESKAPEGGGPARRRLHGPVHAYGSV